MDTNVFSLLPHQIATLTPAAMEKGKTANRRTAKTRLVMAAKDLEKKPKIVRFFFKCFSRRNFLCGNVKNCSPMSFRG